MDLNLSTPLSVERLLQFEPKTEWFLKGPLGVHGVAHETRVLILTQLLCQMIKSDLSADDLAWASIFHDTQRQDDWIDADHGKRAAKFVRSSFPKTSFNPDLNVKNVTHLCEWHATNDDEIPSLNEALKVFKDADALDRWRIGDLNPDFLRFPQSVELASFSYDLWAATRDIGYSKNENAFRLIIERSRTLGVVK